MAWFGLPNVRYFPVSYVHNCNERSKCKCYSQEQGGIWDERVLCKEVGLQLPGNFTIDFAVQILDLQ